MNILTFGAHNDDYIIGAGGTLAKYAKDGKKFYSVIFSFGEQSHPIYQEKVTANFRVKESIKADKILGGSGVRYLGLKEGRFLDERDKAKKAIKKIIKEKKPEKIFTHSPNDPHFDHNAVYNIVTETLDDIKYKGDVYSFDVWNIINVKKQDQPQLVVDIKDTFDQKIRSFKAHKSQKVAIWTLLWNVYLKAILNGRKHGYRYCEVFNKIR